MTAATRVLSSVSIAIFLASCAVTGSGSRTGTPSPLSGSRIVAAIGNSEAEVRKSIERAQRAKLIVRYVRIQTSREDRVFTPFAQILRTKDAIVARAYDQMYIWNSHDATVYWSGSVQPVNAMLPVVQGPNLDTVARRLSGRWSGGLVTLRGRRERTHTDPWGDIKDPWQIAPDFETVAPPEATLQPLASGSTRKVQDLTGVCGVYFIGGNLTVLEGCYYYSYYYSPFGYRVPGGGGGGGVALASPPPCAPSTLPASIKTAYNNDLFAQALVQAVAAANNGTPPTVNEIATRPSDAPKAVALGGNATHQLDWFDDQVGPAVKAGYSAIQIFVHELLHMWYGNIPPGGSEYPEPVPGNKSFVASPSVTLDDGTVVQFDLLNANGSLNDAQYVAYQHLLIHDDLVQQYGIDTLTGALADALANATSVKLPGGSAQKMDAATAQATVGKLKSSAITNRNVKRPPSTPSSTGGCTSTSSRSRLPAAVRGIRAVENVGGFVIYWDGVPGPNWPN